MHSGLGVLAGVLYFLNKRAFIGLTYLWLVAQLVIISGGVYGEGATIVYWDLTMAFDTNFSFGFFLDDLHLSIDVFSLLMLVVFSRVNRRKVSLV